MDKILWKHGNKRKNWNYFFFLSQDIHYSLGFKHEICHRPYHIISYHIASHRSFTFHNNKIIFVTLLLLLSLAIVGGGVRISYFVLFFSFSVAHIIITYLLFFCSDSLLPFYQIKLSLACEWILWLFHRHHPFSSTSTSTSPSNSERNEDQMKLTYSRINNIHNTLIRNTICVSQFNIVNLYVERDSFSSYCFHTMRLHEQFTPMLSAQCSVSSRCSMVVLMVAAT